MIKSFVLCLFVFLNSATALPLQAQTHEHEHSHPTTQPNTLTQEQVILPVLEAREQYKAQCLVALEQFSKHILASQNSNDDPLLQKQLLVLSEKLKQDIKAVNKGEYISEYAGSEKEFAFEHLEQQQKNYVKTLDDADKTYADAIQAALKNDAYAYIGKMVIRGLDQCIDIELMCQLMEYYWHHAMLDTPPASFEGIIKLSYRVVELEPQSPEIYTNAAWLLWSRWVTWKQKPEGKLLGEGDDQTAIALLLKGRKANMENAAYHFDAAMTVWGLAMHHKPEYFQFIIESLHLGDKYAGQNKRLQTNIRRTIGHAYRKTNRLEDAKKAYLRALELAPEDEIIKRLLKELEEQVLADQA